MNYNSEQQKAISHVNGPMMVLAGPGSGKTSVITGRTYHMIHKENITPSSILVVTFTKAAAKEMRERFLSLTGEKRTDVTFGTFHSVFFGILKHAYKIDGSNILREEEKTEILREQIQAYSLEITDESEFLESLEREISLVKNERISIAHYYSTTCSEEIFRKIYQSYHEICQAKKKLDFDDMLVYCYELFAKRKDILKLWQDKFRYILIDEFQDINLIQYEIMKMLVTPRENIFIVGDDDQSIYQFRGAKPQIMLNFPKDYPDSKTIHLTINYRCTDVIVKAATKLLSKNKYRYKKQLEAQKKLGAPIVFRWFDHAREEAAYLLNQVMAEQEQGVPLEEMAVLFRTNMGARAIVDKCVEFQIPFQMRDLLPNIYDHWIAKNMITYMQMGQGSRLRRDFLQVMNRPNRYLSRDAVGGVEMDFDDLYDYYEDKGWMQERIATWERDVKVIGRLVPFAAINYIRKSVGYDEYLKEYGEYRRINPEELFEVLDEIQESAKGFPSLSHWLEHIEAYTRELKEAAKKAQVEKKGIHLSTLHSVKGLEYKKVYIIDVNEGVIPYHKAVLDTDVEEERRMFYVGMTRAKEQLSLYAIREKFDKKMEISRFLEEIEVELDGGIHLS